MTSEFTVLFRDMGVAAWRRRPADTGLAKRQAAASKSVEIASFAREFRLTLIGEENTASYDCVVEFVTGRRLMARLPKTLPPGACVKLEFSNSLVLGECIGCVELASGTFTMFELREALIGAETLARQWALWLELEGVPEKNSFQKAAAAVR